MRSLATAVVLALAASSGASSKTVSRTQTCAGKWRAAAHGSSQTRSQFMATCTSIGTPGKALTPPPGAQAVSPMSQGRGMNKVGPGGPAPR